MIKGLTQVSFIAILLVLGVVPVSAYNHATYELSEKWSFNEDIAGEDRSFTLKHSLDIPRNYGTSGYYDWRYKPNRGISVFADEDTNSAALSQAFKTFQQDSQDQTELEKIDKTRPKYFYKYGYSSYNSYRPYSIYRYGF